MWGGGAPGRGPRGLGSRGPSPRWLCNETIDAGTRRWAVEGLAYLTFDADVKEEFVEDKAAMQAMFHLAKVRAQRCGGGPGWWAPWHWGNVPEGMWGSHCGAGLRARAQRRSSPGLSSPPWV